MRTAKCPRRSSIPTMSSSPLTAYRTTLSRSGELRGCRRPPVLPLGSDIHSGELVRVFGIGGETDGGGAAGGSENICTANATEGSKIRRPPPPLPPSLPGLSVGQTVLHDPSYPLICSSIFFCLWGPDRVDPIQADMMPLLCYRRGPRRSTSRRQLRCGRRHRCRRPHVGCCALMDELKRATTERRRRRRKFAAAARDDISYVRRRRRRRGGGGGGGANDGDNSGESSAVGPMIGICLSRSGAGG